MRISLGVAVTSCALLLSGCSGVPVTTNTIHTSSVPGVALHGRVHGGQNPITGASVYLYAVGTGGYAGPGIAASTSNASQSLLTNPVTTDQNGDFTITNDYTCTANQQVYLYASGGNPGLAPETNNTAAGLLAGLGACSALSSTTYVVVNEVSTIATAYALAGYATDATHISSSGSTLALQDVANAFGAITDLETLSTGVALAATPTVNGGNGTIPQSEINTLANILAACINTTGSVAGPTDATPCYTLLTSALSGGTSGMAPNDTATAAINIAHNPWANIAALYGLQTATSPFQPMLGGPPNDFTIAIAFTGGGVGPSPGVAIDGSGNVWTTNSGGSDICEFTSSGVALSSSSGYTNKKLEAPWGLAVDSSGNYWMANLANNSLVELHSGAITPPTIQGLSGPETNGGLSTPWGIATDAEGRAWVTSVGNNSLNAWDYSSGISIATDEPNGYTGGGLDGPYAIAIDVSGNVWVANYGGNSISELNPSTSSWSSGSPMTGGGMLGPYAIAIDGAGNVWVGNDGINSLSEYSPSTSTWITSSASFTGGGLDNLNSIAIDGSGNVWAANDAGSISEFNSGGTAITGSNGYIGGGLDQPSGIAIDGSGNVWVSDFTASTITEFVGAATPVVTPIVANLMSPYGAYAVNKP